MGRNRSKIGVLADNAEIRVNKFLGKLNKVKKMKRKLLKELNRPVDVERRLPFFKDETCQQRIERIKAATSILLKEVRELEKELKISRKQSKMFGKEIAVKKKRSKSEKLTGRR